MTKEQQPKLPFFHEQRPTIPVDMIERLAIVANLHLQISELLTNDGVTVLSSSYRAKTNESIRAKQRRRLLYHQSFPIVDVYGIRFIMDEQEIDRAADLIVAQYSPFNRLVSRQGLDIAPMPYKVDYRKPGARKYYTSPLYKAVHVYFPFEGDEYYHIGEAQLLTSDWLKTANRTRRHFERRQQRDK